MCKKMDLIKAILDPNQLLSTCFLCFKQSGELFSLYSKTTISYEYNTLEITLKDILNELFPFHDALCNQSCTYCTDLLVKIYTTFQRNMIQTKVIKEIIQKINGEVNNIKEVSGNEIYINFNLSDELTKRQEAASELCCVEVPKDVIRSTYSCKLCAMKFSARDHLVKHKKIAHKNINKSVICEYCGKDCKKSSTLNAHLNTHKEKSCPCCFKTLKLHSHFNVHIKNHENHVKREQKKSYKHCNSCTYKSVNKTSLEAHINKIHLKIRPYICNMCQKGFYKKSHLTEHAFTHNNSKNMVCEICGDNFFNKKTLAEHLRLHSDLKPFECQICNQKFVTSGRRSDHFKRKHMEKTISCFLCDKIYSLKKELNTHLKKVHNHIKDTS